VPVPSTLDLFACLENGWTIFVHTKILLITHLSNLWTAIDFIRPSFYNSNQGQSRIIQSDFYIGFRILKKKIFCQLITFLTKQST